PRQFLNSSRSHLVPRAAPPRTASALLATGARLPQAQAVAPITFEQVDQMGSGCCSSYLGGPPTSRGEADREAACKSMKHAQKYLAQANRHIAELTVQIAHQRAIVKDALYKGQRSEMAESLLDALEGSLRAFEKHRIFLLGSQRQPSE